MYKPGNRFASSGTVQEWRAMELIREYFPGIRDEDLNILLWKETSFPFGDETHLCQQLQILKEGAACHQKK